MPIVPIDLFLNALFTLFSCYLLRGTSPPNLPRDKGERLKRWKGKKVKGCRHHIKMQQASNAVHLSPLLRCVEFLLYNHSVLSWYELLSSYAAHLYRLLPIGRIAWYKLLSSYAAHLSPCKGKKERGLLIPNWRITCIKKLHTDGMELLCN